MELLKLSHMEELKSVQLVMVRKKSLVLLHQLAVAVEAKDFKL